MDFQEILVSATEALAINKLRTILATLGIVIGISSVIALLSLGQGGQKAIEGQIESLGSNLLTVVPGALRPGDFRSTAGTSTTLTLDDAKVLLQTSKIVGIKNVSAELLRRDTVTSGRNSTNTQVIGVLPAYFEVRNIEMASGVFISQRDIDAQKKVVVLGSQAAESLFGENATLGQSIRINKISFKVIGVMRQKGGVGFSNQDDVVLVPLLTAQKQLFGVDYIGSISIEVEDAERSNEIRDEVGYLLLTRHKITDPQNADFTIFSQEDILETAQQITGTFTAILSGIAAISLLVGGIGIMNIMLVTVVERTREIGLRKALGAKKSDVIRQFLLESIILTLVGGFLGMTIGIVVSFLVSKIINLPFIIAPPVILLAMGVSITVGILFGWYPARRASNMQPIEALRYE